MPTTNTRTVKPSGGDYTSLSAWEAGRQANLVTGDIIEQAECYAMSDTTNVTIDGWTTDATRYIRIYTPSAERHDGKWNTSKYRLETSSGYSIDGFEQYWRVEGLQIKSTDGGGTTRGILSRGTGEFRCSHSIIRGVMTSSVGQGINSFAGEVFKVWNCIFYDWGGSASSAAIQFNSAAGSVCYSCTVQSGSLGYENGAGTNVTIKDCLAQDATDGFNGTWHSNSTNNCSDIASDAPGSNAQTGEVTFVDEANDDFHLSASDTVAKDTGADLSADGTLAFSDDIDGETRSGTWDIGADEVLASGAIAGTAAVVFGGSGSLTGSGTLAGTAAVSFGGSADLDGAGATAGTATLTLGGAGVLVGSGALVATAAVVFGGSADLDGAGVLAGTAPVTFGGSGELSGMGGTAALVFGGSGILTGSGALAGTAALVFGGHGRALTPRRRIRVTV